MGVISVTSFRTEPGRLADHMAAAEEAVGHLQRLGLAAISLQPIAGSDIGSIGTVINYANNAAYVAAYQKIMADADWQEFWLRVSANGSAVQVESSIYNDVDPDFQPDPDRVLGVLLVTQWRPKDGRTADFIGKVMESIPLIERMGGTARVLQSLIGAYPMTFSVGVTFGDLDAYGAYADKTAADEEWQAFWASVGSDPTADLVRSGLYLNASA